MLDYLPFIIFLMILAVFLQADSILTVAYMLLGSFLLGIWWDRRGIQKLHVQRRMNKHAFINENLSVEINFSNPSILPIIWMEIHESLPTTLRATQEFKQVISLGMRGKKTIHYHLNPTRRGYYPIGPLFITSGDLFGIAKPAERQFETDYLTVYPQIYPLAQLGLPSRSPFGVIKHHNPIYEDPSRIKGKRGYQPGDSQRMIDWKATAVSGKLQVKQYEASIAHEIALYLDLAASSYDVKKRFYAVELAISVAASVASWATKKKERVGLFTNGSDGFQADKEARSIPVRSGSGHLMSLLEVLARLDVADTAANPFLLQKSLSDLPWGTTLIYISGQMDEACLNQLINAQRQGMHVVVLIVGQTPNWHNLKAQLNQLKIQSHLITASSDIAELAVTTTIK